MAAGKMQRFYKRDEQYISVEELLLHVRNNPLKRDGRRIPVCIWGSRGIGKTAQVQAFCRKYGLQMVTYHPAHDVTGQDIVGKPEIDENGNLRYATPDFLPKEDDPGEGVWFIDEINRGNEQVLAGLMEPLGEGTISQSGWRIPDGWQIVVAANPYTTAYHVKEMDTAMVSRMLHYNPGWEASRWAAWAKETEIHDHIIDFMMRRPDVLAVGSGKDEFQIPAEIEHKIEANPRSFEYFDALYSPDLPEYLVRAIGYGLIGRPATNEFLEDREQSPSMLDLEDIIGSPDMVNDNVAHPYPYQAVLQRWIGTWGVESEELERAVNGIVQRVTAHLINLGNPPSGDPSDAAQQSVEAQRFGRFLACLPEERRVRAKALVKQAAPEWSPVVDYATDLLVEHFAVHGSPIQK